MAEPGMISELPSLMATWEAALKRPDWYLAVVPELAKIKKESNIMPVREREALAEDIYSFFENKLTRGDIALGNERGFWDKERKPIDSIIIHHTKTKPGLTRERLSAMTLVRLYVAYYAHPYDERDVAVKGRPVSSSHFRGDVQIFWPYHWIIRMDGTAEPLLRDNEIGWHAGNWDMNCRSVAIVLDNDYRETKPAQAVLCAAANVIREHYPDITKERIFGHREVRTGEPTSCPSNLFLSHDGTRGWKEDLIELL